MIFIDNIYEKRRNKEKMNKKISLAEIREIELDLLKELVRVCKDHNLRYFLAGGTLLGAIRHHGFIPWDDDIDVLMPRRDYRKLCAIFREKNKGNSEIFSINDHSDYYYTFLKLVDTRTEMINPQKLFIKDLGVGIDIFPMDGMPEDKAATKRLLKKIRRYYKMQYAARLPVFPNDCRWYKMMQMSVRYFLGKRIGYKKLIQKIENLATQYDFETCDYIGCSVAGYGIKERVSKKAFESTVQVQFEDGYYNAPAGYDEYLANLYGDYMQLPPEKKRVLPHKNEAYWK
jgi:lipopolysaccharide cholinephosphotransferase